MSRINPFDMPIPQDYMLFIALGNSSLKRTSKQTEEQRAKLSKLTDKMPPRR